MNYFTSDTHAWHTNIIKYCSRPFANAFEMTEVMANNINAVVRPQDTLYHLGDFSFGYEPEVMKFRSMIKCKNIVLILGNHDKEIQHSNLLRKQFSAVHYLYEFQSNKHLIVLCHYSMRSWHNDRYGAWQLYGHSHGTLLPAPGSNSLDVGVDCNDFKPLSEDQIQDIFMKGRACDSD